MDLQRSITWLMLQEGLPAVRARRALGLDGDGDEKAVAAPERKLKKGQRPDGSFGGSPMKTAGVLCLLDDLKASGSDEVVAGGASFLLSVLDSQPGYERAKKVKPGSLKTPCDLCGFFGPYDDRALPEAMAHGAQEMNFYREHEPLLGPKSPVRGKPRNSLDRAGPGSCYTWGLIPLAYTVEALCRAGRAQDKRLRPAINVLLGAQRESGGWCRNLGGHPSCSLHAIRAVGAHPRLRQSKHAEQALGRLLETWRGANVFAILQVASGFDLPIAHALIQAALEQVAPRQQKNGAFGTPCKVERVAAVIAAARTVEGPEP